MKMNEKRLTCFFHCIIMMGYQKKKESEDDEQSLQFFRRTIHVAKMGAGNSGKANGGV